MIMSKVSFNTNLYSQIAELLQAARKNVVRAVNQTMVITYFEIGKVIVNEEQNGKERAAYGKEVLKDLSAALSKEFGRGYSVDNLENMRRFYLAYRKSDTLLRISGRQISETVSRKLKTNTEESISQVIYLTWSHYLILIRLDNEDERNFYEIEAYKNNWSVRELQRQLDTALYTRLILSRDKEKVKELSEKGLIIDQPKDVIKDPYILEFLGLPEHSSYSESELEEQIISKLEHFLLELGNGFTFVGRQVRFTFDEEHYRIDLVFYNRLLKCFVLIDLKIGKLRHQDLGQMQMYVNYYDRFVKLDDENKTIGIILCKDKKDTMVEITLPENNQQIFASKYELILPSKEQLKKVIETRK
jgi:predicted nuclease of restriction endonuclease-like (RecB) superfamily